MRLIRLNYDNGVSVILPLEDIRIVEGNTSIDIYTPYRTSPYQINVDIDAFASLAYGDYGEEGEFNIIDISEPPSDPAATVTP